jgi:hypothetical protein
MEGGFVVTCFEALLLMCLQQKSNPSSKIKKIEKKKSSNFVYMHLTKVNQYPH